MRLFASLIEMIIERDYGDEAQKSQTFTSKVGQFVEVMRLEEFGNALFIDHEIQVAEKDEKIYSDLN